MKRVFDTITYSFEYMDKIYKLHATIAIYLNISKDLKPLKWKIDCINVDLYYKNIYIEPTDNTLLYLKSYGIAKRKYLENVYYLLNNNINSNLL